MTSFGAVPSMRLPWSLRDPAFLRRKQALANALTERQRNEIMSVPLVTDRPFEPYTHCPLGHPGEHEAGFPPTNHAGRPHVARKCLVPTCLVTWLMPLDP